MITERFAWENISNWACETSGRKG